MVDGPALALQAALVAALRADAGVAALVGARVYDEPPQDVVLPYVRLGNLDASALRMDCHTDTDITVSIECHSRPASGRVEAGRMAYAVRLALDDVSLTLAGHTLDWCYYLTESVTRAPDGRSYIAVVAFEASTGIAA